MSNTEDPPRKYRLLAMMGGQQFTYVYSPEQVADAVADYREAQREDDPPPGVDTALACMFNEAIVDGVCIPLHRLTHEPGDTMPKVVWVNVARIDFFWFEKMDIVT